MPSTWEELRELVRRAEHDEKQLLYLHEQAGKLELRRAEREQVLRAEGSDVLELEKFSLEGLLLKWLGAREGLLERERREELEARLRFEQAKDELAHVTERVGRLEQAAPERRRVEREFAEASERRRAEVAARGGSVARRLAELDARLEEHRRRRFELDEARAVCAEARAELAGIVDALNDAWAYGAADLVAIGHLANFGAELGKRHYLDRVHEHMTRAADALRRLEGELADTGLRVELDLALPEGLAVADHWFDWLISDWLTQGRLSESRARAQQVLAAVEALATRLQQAESVLDAEMARDRRLLEDKLGD